MSDILYIPFVLLGIYILLEASDLGISVASAFLGRSREEKEAALSLLAPCLDGNELWLIAAGLFTGFGFLEEHIALLGLGAVAVATGGIRFFAVILKKTSAAPLLMRLSSLCSLVALLFIGMASWQAGAQEAELFSAGGLLAGLWVILMSLQAGTAYGSVKVSNPLGEHFRALSLLSAIGAVLLFLAILFVIPGGVLEGEAALAFCGASFILYIGAFILLRMRKNGAGWILSWLALASAILFYVTAFTKGKLPMEEVLAVSDERAIVLGAAAIWSLASLAYRTARKQVIYEWKDHI